MSINDDKGWGEVERRAREFEVKQRFPLWNCAVDYGTRRLKEMKYVATFEHGKKQWCVQLIEQGPCPIVAWCDSQQEAIDQADLCNKFPVPVNEHWAKLRIFAQKGSAK